MADASPGLALPAPFRLHRYDVLPSTNDEAKRLAAEGAEEGTLVWARSQTQGRGRLDRDWASPPGNLYVSFVLRPPVPAARAVEIGFVAALAVADCVQSFNRASVSLKWPNDVLEDGRKIAGILLETQSAGAGAVDALVLGIGINVASHPEGVRMPATSLHAIGPGQPKVESVLRRLCEALNARLAEWRSFGFDRTRAHWLGRAHGIGVPTEVSLGSETVSGIFRGLDAGGALLLETRQGLRRITAGDVRFDPR